MPTPRVRYLDLLRVVAIAAVVVGHWLMVDITYRDGDLSGRNAIQYVSWAGWLTLGFQVIPVFFLVGGYVDALSWPAHRASGATWAGWAYARSLRVLWPTSVYVVAMTATTAVAQLGDASPRVLAQAGWLVALHLWFVPVYLLTAVLTPVALAAHHRWGLRVPLAMAAAAALVDAGAVAWHLPVVGFANYLLVWGAIHQLGILWQDGRLGRPPYAPYALVAAGSGLLAVLVTAGPFPLDMIGAGEHPGNTSPPSMALLAFSVAQAGVVVAAEPAVTARLAADRTWRAVRRLEPFVLPVYLWHMVPVVVVAAVLFPTAAVPQPDVGSWEWWALRPAWIAVLASVLIPLAAAVSRAQRPLRRVRPVLPPGRWPAVCAAAGLVTCGVALARLAIRGFAPGGTLAVWSLVAYAVGLTALWAASSAPVATLGTSPDR